MAKKPVKKRKPHPDRERTGACYERISRDDGAEGESNSVQTQKIVLEREAREKGYTNILHYADDGISGTSMDRPGLTAMLKDIEAGKISAVFVKDTSRLGRDYLGVGKLLEEFFPYHDVRFISVSDGVDSDRGEDDLAPFRNIMNEQYLRDTSRKVKASHKARGTAGKRLTFAPIYGYRQNPQDKSEWLVDPEAAEVVRRIFKLTIEGKGPVQIARILSEGKVERPSHHMTTRGYAKRGYHDMTHPYAWSGNPVGHILSKPEYMGHTVNFRTYKDSYKDKQTKFAPPEDWVIFEGIHPAIIDRET